MKKFYLLLSFLASSSFIVNANLVTTQAAETVAVNFLKNKGVRNNFTLELTKSYISTASDGQAAFYVFNIHNGKGFVIVSADDAVRPVLAYSINNNFPQQVTNKEVAYWMDGYNQQISQVIARHAQAAPEIVAEWSKLTATAQENGQTSNKPTDVSPLLLSEWDQMDPFSGGNYLYNNLCPSDAPTGCVATAMAQIMYFWQHPAIGTGSHSYNCTYTGSVLSANFGTTTYDWANMPPTLLNAPTTAEINAVGELMYHCGISVDMNYDYGVSGAWVIAANSSVCSESAFKNYFGYKSTIQGNVRADYADTQWIKMLKFELDNGRPVLYTGWGLPTEGHAFDFDGYEANDYFHINWGWSGQGNGYFTIDNLDPFFVGTGGGSGTFNNNQQALIMIEPANSTLPPNPYSTLLEIAATITQNNDTIIFNKPYSISGKIRNKSAAAFTNANSLALIAEDVLNSNNFFLLDQRAVNISPVSNYTFAYSTNGNTNLVPGKYRMNYVYALGTGANTIIPDGAGTNGALLTVLNDPTGISGVQTDNGGLKSYPNPATDVIALDWSGFGGKVASIQLFNILGQEVYHNSETLNATNAKIAVSHFASGNYSMRIVTDKGTFAKKITVK